MLNSIETRRTIRKYSDRNVDEALLNSLLARSMRTQTMGNLQLYSVVVTRDAKMKSALLPAHFGQQMVTEAPVVLTFCADFHRVTRWCEERKANPGYDNMLSFLNAMSDCLLYCQTFCNLAEESGLGLCYLGTTLYNADRIIDTLHLPELTIPVATITLGWPAEEPALTDRLPLSAIVHAETYGEYSREVLDTVYEEKEHLAENIHFVELNKKETLAQVFTDCRYRKEDNEAISARLMDTLRKQGFLND